MIREKTEHLGTVRRGWSTSYAGSRFGKAWLLRAAVAMDQIYVLDKGQALYPVAHLDGNGAPLNGAKNYMLCDLPPVNAFWSMTLYYAKGFLVPNSIKRYSIGDRTPGIRYEADGSLRLYLQSDNPGAGRASNWLPTPKEGFMLMMRLYEPKPAKWSPPAIVPVTGDGAAECPAR